MLPKWWWASEKQNVDASSHLTLEAGPRNVHRILLAQAGFWGKPEHWMLFLSFSRLISHMCFLHSKVGL